MILKKYDQTLILEKNMSFSWEKWWSKRFDFKWIKRIFNNNFQIFYEKDVIQDSEVFYNEIYSKSFFEKKTFNN